MDTNGLSAICASLGIVDDDHYGNIVGYTKGDFCLDNLKDLLRFLRRDDPQSREVFIQVCKWEIASKDLVPILRFCQKDRNLVLNAVKVLVFLTMPIEASSSCFVEQNVCFWRLKKAITNADAIAAIVSLLEGPLENLQNKLLTEEDWKMIQLVMTLFRNVLAIQDSKLVQNEWESAIQLLHLRDKFLELLFNEHVMDIVIVITEAIGGSCCYFREDNLLLLEIFHYTFSGQDPQLLAKAGFSSKAGGDKSTCADKLKSIMEEEQKRKRIFRQRNASISSQFRGTFTRLTLDGFKTVCKGDPSSSSRNVLLRRHKAPRGHNKRIVQDNGELPITEGKLLGLLHDFLNHFMSGGYNGLMQSVREDIEKETKPIERNDIAIFFQVAQFVSSFQYHKYLLSKSTLKEDICDQTTFNGDICGPIAATMDESMFVLVHARWRYAFDSLKETQDHRFLCAAGSLMKIMVRMLDMVIKFQPADHRESQTAHILLYKLLYDQTDQGLSPFLLNSIKSFDSHKQRKSFLADLIETIHVMLRLIENLQTRGTLRVSKRARKSRKMTQDSKQEENKTNKSDGGAQTEAQAVHSFQTSSNDPNSEQEKFSLSSEPIVQDNLVSSTLQTFNRESAIGDDDDDTVSSSGNLSSDEEPVTKYEVDFKVSAFASVFASHNIVKNLCWLLAFYKSNPVATNHYIVSLLKRITDDLDLSPMLYQLSVLQTFYDILEEQKSFPSKNYEEIVDFLTSLVGRMMRRMKSRPFLFVELLFWKSRKECHLINADHLLHDLRTIKKQTSHQNSAALGDNDEEIQTSNYKEWQPRSIADALGDDEADVVIPHEHHKSDHSDREAMEDSQDEAPKKKKRLVLTDELKSRLKDLYEKYKDGENCCRQIAESLSGDFEVSPNQVLNKLKLLGLSLSSKKKMRRTDKLDSSTVNLPEAPEVDVPEPATSDGNLLDEPLRARRKRRSIGKDQEPMIISLFDQFKDDKRCSYMIASALSTSQSITPAQVSRKLGKLGLKPSKVKKSKTDEQRFTDSDNQIQSDDETLLSLKNRKHRAARKAYQETSDDWDDQVIVSFLKRNSKEDKPLTNGSTDNSNGREGDSDRPLNRNEGPNDTSFDTKFEGKIASGQNSPNVSPNSDDAMTNDELFDQLEDSDHDDGASNRLPMKRKLVFDDDDSD